MLELRRRRQSVQLSQVQKVDSGSSAPSSKQAFKFYLSFHLYQSSKTTYNCLFDCLNLSLLPISLHVNILVSKMVPNELLLLVNLIKGLRVHGGKKDDVFSSDLLLCSCLLTSKFIPEFDDLFRDLADVREAVKRELARNSNSKNVDAIPEDEEELVSCLFLIFA